MPSATRTRVCKSQPRTMAISNFARIAKPYCAETQPGKPKFCIEIPAYSGLLKRKAEALPPPEDTVKITSDTPDATKKRCRRSSDALPEQKEPELPRTPKRTSKKRTFAETASPGTKEAGALFKKLRLESTPRSNIRSSELATTISSDADDEAEEPAKLPSELLDLLGLQAAFFRTLTLHYAHNGTNTPVDLRHISPAVAQLWSKRRLTMADIRRCVGVLEAALGSSACPFYVAEYGQGRVCLELHEQHVGRSFDEPRMCHAFGQHIRKLWSANDTSNTRSFILGLPKATVRPSQPLSAVAPMLAKGQQARAELMTSLAAVRGVQAAKSTPPSTKSTATVSKMSLLDRIRMKEEQLTLLGGGTSSETLARQAALQRAGDVAAVLNMLGTSSMGQGRVSYTMVVLLQKLKDSLRLPLATDEGAECVRILAAEIAPEWIKVVNIGAREHVVLQTAFALSRAIMQQRVQACLNRSGPSHGGRQMLDRD